MGTQTPEAACSNMGCIYYLASYNIYIIFNIFSWSAFTKFHQHNMQGDKLSSSVLLMTTNPCLKQKKDISN